MSSKAMRLKGKIKNHAKRNNIAAQVVLQNYMFERFLERLSQCEYKEKFVVKGGMLVAAIVGLDTRSTMDLDTTLRNLPLKQDEILQAFEQICSIDLKDDVSFRIVSINQIRKDDVYGGYCVRIDALYDTIITPLSIDVSTGDVITPEPVKYEFSGIFDESVSIELYGYNIETVLAEKIETIMSRGVYTTRPRDFYDIYILNKTQVYDRILMREALEATAIYRGSIERLENMQDILREIIDSEDLKNMWDKYRKRFSYSSHITYEDIMKTLEDILEMNVVEV